MIQNEFSACKAQVVNNAVASLTNGDTIDKSLGKHWEKCKCSGTPAIVHFNQHNGKRISVKNDTSSTNLLKVNVFGKDSVLVLLYFLQ